MKTPRPGADRSRSASGLTLIELLVVMCIIGLGWFALLPAISSAPQRRARTPLDAVNTLLDQARSQAMTSGRIQELTVRRGSDRLSLTVPGGENREAALPAALSGVALGGAEATAETVRLRVYPEGAADDAVLKLSDGQTLTLAPLSAHLATAASGDWNWGKN